MSDAVERSGGSRDRPGRRIWPAELKRRIIAESFEPGASTAEVARRYGLNANLVFTWRQRLRTVEPNKIETTVKIVPVTITAPAMTAVAAAASSSSGRMEIVLVGGARILVGTDVETAALTRVIGALSPR